MPKFMKKPVEVEAVQWDGTDSHEAVNRYLDTPEGVMSWSKFHAQSWGDFASEFYGIHTLEGVMRLSPGDWIIKGVKGEFYPCKPDIFAATYEDAAIALMRGQSEAASVVIDGVTYEQCRDEAGDEIGCDRCQSDSAYTIEHALETVDDEEGPGRAARLCPFCYTTHAGSMLKYKFADEAERRETNKHMIQCFNVLLNAQVQATPPKDSADEQ